MARLDALTVMKPVFLRPGSNELLTRTVAVRYQGGRPDR